MKKWLVLGNVLLILMAGCSSAVSGEEVEGPYMETVNNTLHGSGLSEYLTGDAVISDLNSHEVENYPFFEFDLELEVEEEFYQLTDDEIYDLLHNLDKGTVFVHQLCAEYIEARCSVNSFTLSNETDTYVVEPYMFSIEKNGDYFNPEPTPVFSNIDEEVYEYMKNQYEQLTNYGETYNPEVHDPLVAEMAAEEFGITVEEVDRIYIEKEMNAY